MFKEERDQSQFNWAMLGDIAEGRPNLGNLANLAVYRLMQFTLRDEMIRQFGVEAADRVFYEAGRTAGKHFFLNVLENPEDFAAFLADLQQKLKDTGVGVLKVEDADMDRLQFRLTVAEDLDCSGLPVCSEAVCTYDEGFISGVMTERVGREMKAKEVDCWCTGDRVCRFEVEPA